MNKTKARSLVWLAAALLACTGCSSGDKASDTGGANSGKQQSSDINRRPGQDPSRRPSMAGGGTLPAGGNAKADGDRDRGGDTRSEDRSESSRGETRDASDRDRGNANSRGNSDARSQGGRTAKREPKREPKSAPKMKLVAAFPNSSGDVGLDAGNLVPEITGEDLEGTSFKLSDYKGKVIMLDFWGDW